MSCLCAFLFSQGEVVYKHVEMSQGIYFVTKGIAEAYAKGSAKEQADSAYGAPEETIKGIVAEGNIFGYTRLATIHKALICDVNLYLMLRVVENYFANSFKRLSLFRLVECNLIPDTKTEMLLLCSGRRIIIVRQRGKNGVAGA